MRWAARRAWLLPRLPVPRSAPPIPAQPGAAGWQAGSLPPRRVASESPDHAVSALRQSETARWQRAAQGCLPTAGGAATLAAGEGWRMRDVLGYRAQLEVVVPATNTISILRAARADAPPPGRLAGALRGEGAGCSTR